MLWWWLLMQFYVIIESEQVWLAKAMIVMIDGGDNGIDSLWTVW
jgi:hypothetical protein